MPTSKSPVRSVSKSRKYRLSQFLPRRRISVAWAQLSHRKVRFAVALSGIAFANLLIFMQLGFRSLFTTGATALPEALVGDLFLVEPTARFISSTGFERIRLYQTAAVNGVSHVVPLYVNGGSWVYSATHATYDARIFGFNPQQPAFRSPELQQQSHRLQEPDTVLFDRLSREDLGPIPQVMNEAKAPIGLLNRRRVRVVGLFTMGNSFFVGDGNLLVSESSYRALFGSQVMERVSVGLVSVNPGEDVAAVKARIESRIPGVKVLTRSELVEREVQFQESTPAGPIFSFGAVMGFIIGIVIVYQVLYADINDHLAEYATLKAMGYSQWRLLGIIFQEAILLGVLGFIPGFIVSYFMYQVLGNITRLALMMRPDVAIAVFVLTLIMCIVSAAIASNRLRSADPADIFN